jgi:hypothetical protein
LLANILSTHKGTHMGCPYDFDTGL